VVLVLDDNKGAAPKRAPSPNPRPKVIQPAPTVPAADLLATWNAVVDKPVSKRSFAEGAIRTLTADVKVFKKIYCGTTPLVANLILPAGTRVHITDHKCRADKAIVHSMFTLRGVEKNMGRSSHCTDFVYRKGKTVVPTYGFSPYRDVCAGGIHFFLSSRQAYYY
jgi:hypothetical protein